MNIILTRDLQGQAMQLIERMRAMDDIDFEKDWKIVTVRVGAVDLCHYADHGTTGPDVNRCTLFIYYLLTSIPKIMYDYL